MVDALVTWLLEAKGSSASGPCPVCQPWGDQTEFLTDFAANPGLPPLHYNCLCDVIPVLGEEQAQDVQDAVQAQNDWLESQGFLDISTGGTLQQKVEAIRQRTDLLRQAAAKMRAGDFG
ncbi:MAG: hypothetical protein ACYTFZ_04005 [Planctomycetota bacterium]|jgi:hypothetical protein